MIRTLLFKSVPLVFIIVLIIDLCIQLAFAEEVKSTLQPGLTIEMAIKLAQKNDPWLAGRRYIQDAYESKSIAAGTLPDPKVNVGLANMPLDTFDFGQEGMTQFKVGVSQMFPRGNSLALRQQQLELVASQYPFQIEDRKAKVAVTTGLIWLDIYKAQESIALIEKERFLFEQLSDVARASYSAALGKSRQQDIVRAQLEVTRIDDRLDILKQQLDMGKQRLYQWTSQYFVDDFSYDAQFQSEEVDVKLATTLPRIKLLYPELYLEERVQPQTLFQYFSHHPSVDAIEKNIQASRKGVELSKQKYKPEWGVNAGYGYRGDDPLNNDRADLFTIGLSFDLPIFTSNKQDREVQAAVSQAEEVKTRKWLRLREMMSAFGTSKAQLKKLEQRQYRYRVELLPQMEEQAEASLSAYTNDDGDFAEVVRALIAELNARLDELSIDVDIQKTKLQLNYFLMTTPEQMILSDNGAMESNGDKK
ncbi:MULTISPECIES: TolC family protein [Shewanella]|uniref:Transporter n=1 Tax=Shewanella insulae TaxID=2681496 RepID=A0A6L7HTS5_9GAMM|nr:MULTISPECIES: TolC family protein [Shewanella]MCG9723132.1 TolC family protein [Shewanella sp. Isolate7]MXR67702.1 transporter [Shewanella insulae]